MRSFYTGPRRTVIAAIARRLQNDGYEIVGCPRQPTATKPGFVAFGKKGYTVKGIVKVLDTVRRYDEQMIRKIMEAERELDSAWRTQQDAGHRKGKFPSRRG